MMKKLTSALLLAAMLTVSLTACGKAETPPDTTTAPSGAETKTQVTTAVTTENPYDENGYLKDGLPEDLTLNGETVNVYIADYNSAYAVDMYAEQLTGLRIMTVSPEEYAKVFAISPSEWYKHIYDRFFDRLIDNSKILAVTGMRREDFLPLREGLARELNSIRGRHIWTPNKYSDSMDTYLASIGK